MTTVTAVPRRPVVLIILDGYGVNPSKQNNAVFEAPTPHLDEYFSHYPQGNFHFIGHENYCWFTFFS